MSPSLYLWLFAKVVSPKLYQWLLAKVVSPSLYLWLLAKVVSPSLYLWLFAKAVSSQLACRRCVVVVVCASAFYLGCVQHVLVLIPGLHLDHYSGCC